MPLTKRTSFLVWALIFVLLTGCGVNYEKLANVNAQGSAIVCFGDSITRGYGSTPGNDYPSQLGKFIGRPVINAGRDGDTTTAALARLEAVLVQHKPRVMIIELGGNDALQKVGQAETVGNLGRIVQWSLRSGSMVVLVHAKYGLLSDPYKKDFEAIAAEHNVLLVKDALKGIHGRPSRMSDKIHPNDGGYTVLAQRIAEALGPLLEAADKTRAQTQ